MSNDPPPSDPTDFTPPEVSEIAELLPAYEILSFIAKGGMGAVYMARQKSLDRDVAIKILPRHFGEDAEFRASFEAEAKSMAKFNHPNLISIYDFGQIDGLLYIIMEMVQGKSLYHSSYGKTIEPAEVARITTAVCHGLANAHKHGILHRDIKPSNILLDASASPKIGDFGLARPVGDHEADSAFGTPGYTAPEVVNNPTAVDESTDIYSVGAMIYELLTTKLPDSNYVPASTLVQCDPKFDEVIRKAMHPTPALRYRSAEAMAKAIDSIGNSTPTTDTARTLLTASPATKVTRPTKDTSRTLLTAPPVSKGTSAKATKSGGASSTPAPAPLPKGSNAPLIRNIIIIIALLASIYIAWEGLKVVRAKNAEEQEYVKKTNQEAKDAAAKKRAEEADAQKLANQGKQKPPKKPIILDIPKPKIETPRETLSRLKSQLLSGSRAEMPKGSVTQGGKVRFYIDDKMTWHQARQFCENHGGHLTILPEVSDLQILSSKLASDQTIWLGAGSDGNGSGNWQWIDGSPWKHGERKTSKSAYVSVNDTGIPDYENALIQHSFFIEWNMDGSTPATLENQLKRTTESIAEGNPVFPAGTLSYDNRHYLLIQQNTGWETANNLARQAGANLAIPSNLDENEWLISYLASALKPNQACWIGGIRQSNSSWGWSTGEAWEFAKWGEGLPNENASISCGCAVLPSQKWDDYPINKELPYFIIEWSKDGLGKTVVQIDNGPKTNVVAPFRTKCIAGIKSIQKVFEKQFTNNIKGFEQELSVYKRSLVQQIQAQLAPTILALQDYPDNRIRKNLPRENMPAKVAEILDSRLKRQKETEAKYLVQIGALRLKYRAALQGKATELKSKGLNAQLQDIEQELNDLPSNGYKFIDHIRGSIAAPKTNAPSANTGSSSAVSPSIIPTQSSRGWTATASSTQPGADAALAIDGDTSTIWHSVWNTNDEKNRHPHTLDIHFGKNLKLKGVSVTARRTGINGRIKAYDAYTSNNGTAWRKVASGQFQDATYPQPVYFSKTIHASHVRIKALSSHHGGGVCSVAEVTVIEK